MKGALLMWVLEVVMLYTPSVVFTTYRCGLMENGRPAKKIKILTCFSGLWFHSSRELPGVAFRKAVMHCLLLNHYKSIGFIK